MRISRLLACALFPIAWYSCKKEKDPEFSSASLHGKWISSASGVDTNNNRVFDPGERTADNGSYEWTFQTDDTLVIKNKISSTAPLIREWYRVDGNKFYRTSQGGGFSEIIQLDGTRFLIRTERITGFGAEWMELRRL